MAAGSGSPDGTFDWTTISHFGGLAGLADIPLCDDSVANDALWRLTPQSLWAHAVETAILTTVRKDGQGTTSIRSAHHTGSVDRRLTETYDRERENTRLARARLPWAQRLLTRQVRELAEITWPNVKMQSPRGPIRKRRVSLPIGPHGGRWNRGCESI